MRQKILLLVIAVSVGALSVGHAAALGLTTRGVGAGSATILECDTNGFTPTYTTVSGNVTSVLVGGIADPTCEGGALRVTLTNSSGTSIGSGGPVTIPTDAGTTDNSVSVSISPQPSAPLVTDIHISIEGP